MQHSKSDVFQRHYLPRYISADTQAAYRGIAPQSTVMREVSGMRRSIDPRRPRKLTSKQLEGIEKHSRVAQLYDERERIVRQLSKAKRTGASSAALSSLRSARHNATTAYRKEKQRQAQTLLEKVKKEFDREQAIKDIQNQLHNRPVDTIQQHLTQPIPLPRARVCQALFTLPEATPEKENQRKTNAITALTVFCRAEDNSEFHEIYQQCNNTTANLMEPLSRTGGSFVLQCKPTQCFLCLGNRQLLAQKRSKEFYSRKDLEKHLNRHHLKHASETSVIVCPLDGQKLLGRSSVITHWRSSH